MKNEIAYEFRFGEGKFVITVTVMGAKALLTFNDGKMDNLLVDVIEAFEDIKFIELADKLFQQIDAQIRRAYSAQAVTLKRVEVYSFDEEVSIYALR